MVKRSRGKTKKPRRAGARRAVSDNIMDNQYMDEGVVLGNDLQRALDGQITIETTSAEVNREVDRLFDSPDFRPRITYIFGNAGITQEIKQDAKDWAARKIARLLRKAEEKLIRSQQSLNIHKNKGRNGGKDGITDLNRDIASMITERLRDTEIPHGVSRRMKDGHTKKKKHKKKKTRKKRRRSTRS